MLVYIMAEKCRKIENFVTIFLLTRACVFASKKYVRESENKCAVSALVGEEQNKR